MTEHSSVASLRSPPALPHNGGRFASESVAAFSGIRNLLGVFKIHKTVTPTDARQMVKLRPLERLEFVLQEKHFMSAHRKLHELIAYYERFLKTTEVPEASLIKQFLNKKKSKEYFAQANEFGNLVFEVINLIGRDERFYRLLMV